MWGKITSNELFAKYEKIIIQMCACQPGMHSLGSKKRGIIIKTSGGDKNNLLVRERE